MTSDDARKLRKNAIVRLKRLGFHQDAEDLAHDVCLQYLEKKTSRQSLTFAVIDALRARTGRPGEDSNALRIALLASSEFGDAVDALSSTTPSPEAYTESEELRLWALNLITKLKNPKTRQVMKAYFFKGEHLKEIGKTLSLSESAVSLIVSKGLRELREMLSSFKNEAPGYTGPVRGKSKTDAR